MALRQLWKSVVRYNVSEVGSLPSPFWCRTSIASKVFQPRRDQGSQGKESTRQGMVGRKPVDLTRLEIQRQQQQWIKDKITFDLVLQRKRLAIYRYLKYFEFVNAAHVKKIDLLGILYQI